MALTHFGKVNSTGDVTNQVPVSANDPLPVTATISSTTLPTGAATSALQTTGNTSLATIATNTTNAGTPTLQSGSTTAVTQATASNLNATVVGTGTFAVQPAGSVAHDGVGTSVNPVLCGGYASAAAPSDVSADGDAVRRWHLRNGATATVITAAGALVGGDATNGLDVDVTRLSSLVAGSAIIGKVGIDQTTPGTTNAVAATNFPTTVSTGTGAQGSSSPRVTVATDSATVAGSASIPAGTNLMGKVGIDQTTVGTTNAVSLAQIGATTVTSNNGTASAGAQRVVIASDNSAIANWGKGATGSAVPANAQYTGLIAKTSLPTAATDANMVGAMADKFGRTIVRAAPRELLVTAATSTTGTSGTLLAAQGSGVFADIYRFTIANSSVTTVAVTLSDGTVTYTYMVPTGWTIIALSGTPDGAIPATTANTAWTYGVSSGVTTIYVNAQFILNK